ncbi:MAG: hypothetical protein HOV94_15590 [Saccharothrix sp.]|nr:hypothetical protein [Saccharothrix sp.]
MPEISNSAELTAAALALEGATAAALLRDGDGRDVLVIACDGFTTGPQVRRSVRDAGVRPPDRIVLVPSDGNGWEDAQSLLHDPTATVYDFVPPATEREREVCRVWQDVLRFAEVGVEDDLLDLGGDSLLGIEIAMRLEEHFGLELDLDAVFEAGTVRGVAALVERGSGSTR